MHRYRILIEPTTWRRRAARRQRDVSELGRYHTFVRSNDRRLRHYAQKAKVEICIVDFTSNRCCSVTAEKSAFEDIDAILSYLSVTQE